jgi:hypothetical protein
MGRYGRILLFVLVLVPASGWAQGPQGKPFGLGLTLGDPTGISGKYWFSRVHTVDFALGWGFFPYNGAALYGDYLYNALNILPHGGPGFDLLFYLGVGGKIGAWNHHWDDANHHHYDEYGFGLGLRIPFGITMLFSKAPFDLFLELVPCIEFIGPDPVWFDFDFAFGGRFYF